MIFFVTIIVARKIDIVTALLKTTFLFGNNYVKVCFGSPFCRFETILPIHAFSAVERRFERSEYECSLRKELADLERAVAGVTSHQQCKLNSGLVGGWAGAKKGWQTTTKVRVA